MDQHFERGSMADPSGAAQSTGNRSIPDSSGREPSSPRERRYDRSRSRSRDRYRSRHQRYDHSRSRDRRDDRSRSRSRDRYRSRHQRCDHSRSRDRRDDRSRSRRRRDDRLRSRDRRDDRSRSRRRHHDRSRSRRRGDDRSRSPDNRYIPRDSRPDSGPRHSHRRSSPDNNDRFPKRNRSRSPSQEKSTTQLPYRARNYEDEDGIPRQVYSDQSVRPPGTAAKAAKKYKARSSKSLLDRIDKKEDRDRLRPEASVAGGSDEEQSVAPSQFSDNRPSCSICNKLHYGRCKFRCPCNKQKKDDHDKRDCPEMCHRLVCLAGMSIGRLTEHQTLRCMYQCAICGQEGDFKDPGTGRIISKHCGLTCGFYKCPCQLTGHWGMDCLTFCRAPGCEVYQCRVHCPICAQRKRHENKEDNHPDPEDHIKGKHVDEFICTQCEEPYFVGFACNCADSGVIPTEADKIRLRQKKLRYNHRHGNRKNSVFVPQGKDKYNYSHQIEEDRRLLDEQQSSRGGDQNIDMADIPRKRRRNEDEFCGGCDRHEPHYRKDCPNNTEQNFEDILD